MLNSISIENAQNLGIGVLEVVDKRAASKKEPEAFFVPLKETFLSGTITGPVASLNLTQVYSFTKEQCEKVIESRYRFPVPGDAVVTGVQVSFGDNVLKTELKERSEAKEDYKQAKKEGKKALLVTRESPDVFTICIAGIEPGQDVKVETRYVQLARLEGISWSVRVPLTTAPRYTRKDEFSSMHAQGQPLAVLRDPGHRFSLDLCLYGATSVESVTHRINVGLEGDHVRIKLQQGSVIPDKDFVLTWNPSQENTRPSLHVISEEDDADAYFVASVSPPASGDSKKVPGEYVILVDHSGSMEGAKWEAADWAVEKLLRGLSKDDRFALCFFHSTTKWLSKVPMQATEQNVEKAVSTLKASKDSGGTELGVAMEQAVNVKKADGVQTRHIILITDAEVTDEGRILRLISEEAKVVDRRRVSVLCIDAAPNSFFALEMAEIGGGIARFLTSDPAEGDIVTALDSIMESISRPVAAGLRLFVNRDSVAAIGREVKNIGKGNSYIDMGDLPAGGMVWVAGKASKNGNEALSFCLTSATGKGEPVVPKDVQNGNSSAVRGYYGARRILGLEYVIHSQYTGTDLKDKLSSMGYDPEEALYRNKKPSLYPENNQVNEKEALKDLIVSESLHYGIPSSETAFVAVYEIAGKPVETTAIVPNALPEGWSEEFEMSKDMCVCSPPSSSMLRQSIKALPNVMKKSVIMRSPGSAASGSVVKDIICDIQNNICDESPDGICIYSGKPKMTNGEMVLIDTSVNVGGLKGLKSFTIASLLVNSCDGMIRPDGIDKNLAIQVFVGDMLTPKATVRLSDLRAMGGVRPLNISVMPGDVVKLVLRSMAGTQPAFTKDLIISLSIRQ